MKTKLYAFITGLVMAATLSSFGQEIVNQFTIQKEGMNFYYCSLFENNDGTMLFRTMMYPKNTSSNYEHLLLKITPDGEVLDSLTIDAVGDWSYMFRNPIVEDSYILTDDIRTYDETDSIVGRSLRFFFIDANLHLNDEVIVPVAQFHQDSITYLTWHPWFIDTQNDFIIAFWTDDMLHLMRIGFDGTIKASIETDALYAPNYEYAPPQPDEDTTLIYSDMGFGICSESPLSYYIMGGYHPEWGAYPIFGYFFDADFNLIERRLYEQFGDEGFYYDGANTEHILPFDEGSYLTASQITNLTTNASGVGLAKFDLNHNQIAVSPKFGTTYCYPYQTEIVDGNTIYQLYEKSSQSRLALARLDGDLNLNWDITLPGTQMLIGYCMTVLKNGDIVAGGICRKNTLYCASFVTLRDNYDPTSVAETIGNKPYTLFPNPVNDVLNISYSDEMEPKSISLFDLQGQLIGSQSSSCNQVDMSRLPAGTYLLSITFRDGSRQYERVVKQE